MTLLLSDIFFRPPADTDAQRYPFSVPAIRGLAGQTLSLNAPVTVLVGENGSGKSTLIEAFGCAAGLATVGRVAAAQDPTLAPARRLAATLRLSWSRRTHRGYLMRAEDFFGFAQRMQAAKAEAEAEIAAIDADPDLSEAARGYARMPHARELADLRKRYGNGLDTVSHGESFFVLFGSRLAPNSLLILDEPEAPLSPLRQIALLSLFKEVVEQRGGQIIMATHSPILMAYPGAQILLIADNELRPVAYQDVEHVQVLRDFLNAPERFLRHL